jgi:hypothetical protein
MTDHYILDGTTPVPEPDLLTWVRWFETADRRVAETFLYDGAIRISTVFLGLNHEFRPRKPLRIFETMVFAPSMDFHRDYRRYSTWQEAEQGHEVMVDAVRATLGER